MLSSEEQLTFKTKTPLREPQNMGVRLKYPPTPYLSDQDRLIRRVRDVATQ